VTLDFNYSSHPLKLKSLTHFSSLILQEDVVDPSIDDSLAVFFRALVFPTSVLKINHTVVNCCGGWSPA
jgi:hypothetical protein